MRWEPKAQPAVERTNTNVMGSPAASVSGLRKPGGCPVPVNGSAVAKISVSGRMMKLTSMTIA